MPPMDPEPQPPGDERRPLWKKLAVLGLLAAGVATFYLSGLHAALTWENVRAQRDAWRAEVAVHPIAATVVFSLLYVAVTGLSVPVGWVMTVTAGALFGLVWGGVLASVAPAVGATLALVACRYVFRDFARRRLGRWLAVIDRGLARDGAFYVILLRLTPLVPSGAINAGVALTSLPVRTFWWASQVGMLPVSLLYVYAGTVLGRIEAPGDVLSPGLLAAFAVMALLPLVLKRVVR
jgi:uncharacterized membrane protein YdjX (TVP38/TMEM64 family)